MRKKAIVVFSVGLLLIILFYFWSSIFWLSLILLIPLDFFTLKILRKRIISFISPKFKQVYKYVFYLLLILGSAIFLRTFVVDIYYVPSSSMERTLRSGDYVLVNKLSYGVSVPESLKEVPVIGSFFKDNSSDLKLETNRVLKGFKKIQREDIVVFKSVSENEKLLIKRIIGLPGETISIKDGSVYINAKPLAELPGYTYSYRDSTNLSVKRRLEISNSEIDTLMNKKKLTRIIAKKNDYSANVFPLLMNSGWNKDNYGPLLIPRKGMTIKLTEDNLAIYGKILKNYEKVAIPLNKTLEGYTFKYDYYFMMGDNRQKSQDSRFFGFVPSFYIQGKMMIKL